MPEGPELRLNSLFINHVCQGLLFGGRPIRSPVSKSPEILWDSPKYTITSESRGKELALILRCQRTKSKRTRILFRFGMSGKFNFTTSSAIPKHSHLQFFTIPIKRKVGIKDEDEGTEGDVLSFLDARRFGSWHVMEEGWGEERGPDIVNEYDQFRANVLGNLEDSVFGRAICETMLNQKYFNGVGNYLRAEVLFRAQIPPFTRARDVLQPLTDSSHASGTAAAVDCPDVLSICRDVYGEVFDLKKGLGKAELITASVSESDHQAFLDWLQCYNNPSMRNTKDRNGRTIWFKGDPGPLAPKGGKIKAIKRTRVPDNPYPTKIKAVKKTRAPDNPYPIKVEVAAEQSHLTDDHDQKTTPTKPIKVAKRAARVLVNPNPRIVPKARKKDDPYPTTTAPTKGNTAPNEIKEGDEEVRKFGQNRSRRLQRNKDPLPTFTLRRSARLSKSLEQKITTETP